MQENINVTIRVRGEQLTFNLTKNEHVTQVPIFIGNDDGIVPMSDDKDSDVSALKKKKTVSLYSSAKFITEPFQYQYIGSTPWGGLSRGGILQDIIATSSS